jgi:phosphoserine phosphatase
LWCEKPAYPQADFLLRRWKEMADADPARVQGQPWKAVAEGDQEWLAALLDQVPELIRGVTEAYDGITVEAFEQAVRAFFDRARHPVLGVPYTRLAYRPMRELIGLLWASGFDVYLCAGGGRDFVRVVSEEMYGIPRERVIGSGTTLEYRDGAVFRTGGVEQPIDDGPGKLVHIWTRTGRMPLLAGGNADGDIEMLDAARFGLLIRHDDAEREFAYEAGAERALGEAAMRGWTVVSMKDDFGRVFLWRPEGAQGRLERAQAAADDLGLPGVGSPGRALGVHPGAHGLQRGQHIGDTGAVLFAWCGLAHGIERLRQVIGLALDVGPAGAGVRGAQRAGPFRDAHRVMDGGALRVGIDDPGPPARRGGRAAVRGAGDPDDPADNDHRAQGDPEPDERRT